MQFFDYTNKILLNQTYNYTQLVEQMAIITFKILSSHEAVYNRVHYYSASLFDLFFKRFKYIYIYILRSVNLIAM